MSIVGQGSRPMLHGSFHAWAHKVASRKSEAKRCEEETRFSYLQAIFRAWATLAAAGHQSKELEQEKERLRQEQEQLKKEIEDQRLRQSKIRQSMLGFAENQANQYVILGMIWSSWKELLLEKRLLAEHNAERQQWEREFEERQEAERKSLRPMKIACSLQMKPLEHRDGVAGMHAATRSAWKSNERTMNLLALPLERDQIFSIKRRFPGFSGKVPEEAAFWSEADLEAYFGSNGYVALALAAFLTECMGEDGPPSNLFVVGGFPKCSSSHIFRLLQSHPNTVTFGKQVGSLPGAEIEFEKATFAIARTLQIPGKPVTSACTGMPLRALKECKRLVGYIRGSYDNSTAAVLIITDIFFLEKKAMARRWTGKVKLLFVVREPADYLWAAYNFWILPGERKGLQDDWTDTTKHTRSPELFHELVLADGKNPAWQPRSGKVTGLWFNLIQDVKNASAKTLVLKSEDFTDHVSATLDKMASFLGVSASGFPIEVALGRTNSQASAERRGVDTVQKDPVEIGVYEISGSRPMLCATRRVIYSKTQDVCQVLSSSFGVGYDACLGGGTGECSDTGVRTDHGRAVTTMAPPLSISAASMEEAPSNLIVVGGFAKCSSSHIFRLLQSHPNTVTFGKQVGSLPGAEIEFEKATFAIARTLFRLLQSHPNTVTFGKQVGSLPGAEIEFEKATFAIARTLQIPGKPVSSACTGMPLKGLKECNRLVGWIRGRYDNSTPAVLIITDIFFLDKKAMARRWAGKVKLLFMVREPADYLWAAYNFWILPGEPKGLQNDWTDKTSLASARGG
eukprot:s428_g7.t1